MGEIVPGRLLVTSAPPPTARINDGDRTISREDAGTVLFVDVVPHKDIAKCGRKPPGA
jgi:hypothetical protein